jgi:hypothetical protein
MTTAEITDRLAALGWTYVPKSRTAFYPVQCGRIYLRTADRRDYSRLAATLRFAPTEHVTCLAQVGADIAAASHSAEAVADILLAAYEANATR